MLMQCIHRNWIFILKIHISVERSVERDGVEGEPSSPNRSTHDLGGVAWEERIDTLKLGRQNLAPWAWLAEGLPEDERLVFVVLHVRILFPDISFKSGYVYVSYVEAVNISEKLVVYSNFDEILILLRKSCTWVDTIYHNIQVVEGIDVKQVYSGTITFISHDCTVILSGLTRRIVHLIIVEIPCTYRLSLISTLK